jgi:hypothetical protein
MRRGRADKEGETLVLLSVLFVPLGGMRRNFTAVQDFRKRMQRFRLLLRANDIPV